MSYENTVLGEQRRYRTEKNGVTSLEPCTFFIAAFSVTYIAASFDSYLSTSSFDVLFEMSQSQTLQTGVCFMSLLCK